MILVIIQASTLLVARTSPRFALSAGGRCQLRLWRRVSKAMEVSGLHFLQPRARRLMGLNRKYVIDDIIEVVSCTQYDV